MSDADGKVIAATSVSVQSGKAYEQEFALEMEKAKVNAHLPSPAHLSCSSRTSLGNVEYQYNIHVISHVLSLCSQQTGWEVSGHPWHSCVL